MLESNCLLPSPTLPALYAAGQVASTHHDFLASTNTAGDPYTNYADADNFDLSLLPQDCALSTDNIIPTTVYQYAVDAPTTPLTPTTPQIKIEQIWPCVAITTNANHNIKQEPEFAACSESWTIRHQQQQPLTKSAHQLIPPPAYPHIYPSPQSSPTQSEYAFSHRQLAGGSDSLSSSCSSLYASSPCPSIDVSSIKQELHILPPSPPESNCEAPSPHSACSDIKNEPIDADVEALVDLKALLDKPFHELALKSEKTQQPPQDYRLLREYLEDTTFQKKHNLKPLALESFIGGLEEVRGDIEPVISLALEHAKREADEICAKLHISQDPSLWSPQQVHAWLRSTTAQFKLPAIDDLELKFCEDGAALVLLSDEEFTRRAPESGSTLHAQLEIWKMAYSDGYQTQQQPQLSQQANESNIGGATQTTHTAAIWNAECLPNLELDMDVDDDSECEEDLLPQNQNSNSNVTTNVNSSVSAVVVSTNATTSTVAKRTGATGGRNGGGGGSHIHLWQFLKELLSTPQLHGTAIRWIDRSRGIFKIEDSVRVAKLWGRRKNRPAMNYDKLSRSIRQYYKKGIMKKTERSQRLVYQFCNPYHL